MYKLDKWKNKYYVANYNNYKCENDFRLDVTRKLFSLFSVGGLPIEFGDKVIDNSLNYVLTMEECSMELSKMPIKSEINKDSIEYKNIIRINEPLNFGLLINYGENPIDTFLIQLNGHDRFDITECNYFNYIVPYHYYNNVPNDGINVYSFTMLPYDNNIEACLNLNKIDKVVCKFTDKIKIDKKEIMIFYKVFI